MRVLTEITSNEELRRSKRPRKEFSYGNEFQTFLVDNDPLTYFDVISSSDSKFWKKAIKTEIGSIMKNKTWILVDLPPGAKLIGCKWIFKRKHNPDGSIEKQHSFSSKRIFTNIIVNYFDTFASVTRISFIQILFTFNSSTNSLFIIWMSKQLSLNGDLEEKIIWFNLRDVLCLV